MGELSVRAMTAAEFATFRDRTIRDYAEAHVRSGDWEPERAIALATNETDGLLPDGLDTKGMLFLVAQAGGSEVGTAWIALEHRARATAWIYDIVIAPKHRGRDSAGSSLRRSRPRSLGTGARPSV